MHPTIQYNATNLQFRNAVKRAPWRRAVLLIPLALAYFGLLPAAKAVIPPPDGAYAGGNTAEGANALFSRTTGVWNTALGGQALYHDTIGNTNTAVGLNALYFNTTGSQNVAIGVQALQSNTASGNVATGYQALFFNTTGEANTANGVQALYSNTDGGNNTANGDQALFHNTHGDFNTATGVGALFNNAVGSANTANGARALFSNGSGSYNTANGASALDDNTGGSDNTATGFDALGHNKTGSGNTANGVRALANIFNATGSGNIALGFEAGHNLTTGDNNIDIGNEGVAGEANTIRIGTVGTQTKTFIAGISGAATEGATVVVTSSGQLGVTGLSSARFKDEIKPMDRSSEAILVLKPVTFHYKQELDPKGMPQFGLVAEEVAKVNPALVTRDAKGEVYTVRYEAVNAMLLNEFLKEHRKVEKQEATITQLKTTVAQQQKGMEVLTVSLKEQAAQIRKVSDKLEVTKPAPRLVNNK